MRIVLVIAVLLSLTLAGRAQEFRTIPTPTLPMGAPVAPAPNIVPPPIPPQQLSPIPPSLNIPPVPSNQTAQPGAGAPNMPLPEAHAPKCWCTQLNPADGTQINTRCAPECCAQAGAQGCD